MTKHTPATDGVEPISAAVMQVGERAPFWIDMVCRHLIEIECDPFDVGAPFHGAIVQRTVGAIDVSQVASCAQQVTRTDDLLARADGDYFLLNIQRAGCSVVQQDGREAALMPGDMALYSSARFYQLRFQTDFQQTVLLLPAAPLRALSPGVDDLTATRLDGGQSLVALLALTANSYFNTSFEALHRQAGLHAGNTLTEMIAGCLVTLPDQIKPSRSNLASFHLNRIRQYALAHLSDTTLSVAQVGTALAISPAHIHRLFADEAQTFCVWLWECRLQACSLALRQPGLAHLSVSQVAYRYGFSNAAHFSRVFRARFSMTARDWRTRPAGTDNKLKPM